LSAILASVVESRSESMLALTNSMASTFLLPLLGRLTELVKSLATVLEKLAMFNETILHGALWLVTGSKDPASRIGRKRRCGKLNWHLDE
jgi:hypothetical protein